jgi:hypothetical protein
MIWVRPTPISSATARQLFPPSHKEKVRYLTILKTICPVQENVNVVRQEMKTLTNYAGIGFKKQLAEE